MTIPEIPAMAELETDRSVEFLTKHAQLEVTKAVKAVNEANAEFLRAQAKRADAVAGLLRVAAFLGVVLATGWSVWAWVVIR